MKGIDKELASASTASTGDAAAIKCFEHGLMSGEHWYLALLEAIGLWASAAEDYKGRTYRYLIEGEAFDIMLLAERLCQAVAGLLPEEEKIAFLFSGKPPLNLSPVEIKQLIGSSKYRQYLNYFYGVLVEEALVLVVQEEVHKERWMGGFRNEQKTAEEAYQRVYGTAKAKLLHDFRREKGYARSGRISLDEIKEFTYWLFKYRLKHCEGARVASDTRKALEYLKRQGTHGSFWGTLLDPESHTEPST